MSRKLEVLFTEEQRIASTGWAQSRRLLAGDVFRSPLIQALAGGWSVPGHGGAVSVERCVRCGAILSYGLNWAVAVHQYLLNLGIAHLPELDVPLTHPEEWRRHGETNALVCFSSQSATGL